jgi:hypothetical protein
LIYLAQIGLAIGIIYGIHGLDMKPSGGKNKKIIGGINNFYLYLNFFFIYIFKEQLYEDNLTAEMLEDEMRKIRIENQKLENRL